MHESQQANAIDTKKEVMCSDGELAGAESPAPSTDTIASTVARTPPSVVIEANGVVPHAASAPVVGKNSFADDETFLHPTLSNIYSMYQHHHSQQNQSSNEHLNKFQSYPSVNNNSSNGNQTSVLQQQQQNLLIDHSLQTPNESHEQVSQRSLHMNSGHQSGLGKSNSFFFIRILFIVAFI